mmetsp:Transcript_35685/g.101728  ORF Transcript_35685/g.101728 Transcript_35685/m.101728 type:complete len:249 (+) Transcript_35685:244-990(+)
MPDGVVGMCGATTSKSRISSSGRMSSGQSVSFTSVTSATSPGNRASIESASSRMTSPATSFISHGAIFFRLAISFLRCDTLRDLGMRTETTSPPPRPRARMSTSPLRSAEAVVVPTEAVTSSATPIALGVTCTVGKSFTQPALHNNSKLHTLSWSGMTSPNKTRLSNNSPAAPDACKLKSDDATPNLSPACSNKVFNIHTRRARKMHFVTPRHIKATCTPRGPNHCSLFSNCSGVACNFLLGKEPPHP